MGGQEQLWMYAFDAAKIIAGSMLGVGGWKYFGEKRFKSSQGRDVAGNKAEAQSASLLMGANEKMQELWTSALKKNEQLQHSLDALREVAIRADEHAKALERENNDMRNRLRQYEPSIILLDEPTTEPEFPQLSESSNGRERTTDEPAGTDEPERPSARRRRRRDGDNGELFGGG